jgi:hypothetical protein
MVITGAAERIGPRLSSIIYIDAFVPATNQSLNILRGQRAPQLDTVPPPPPGSFKINSVDARWAEAKLTPQPARTFEERLVHAGSFQKIRKKTYIRAADMESPAFDAACAPLRRDPSWTVIDMRRCGHDIMLDRPKELTELLFRSA